MVNPNTATVTTTELQKRKMSELNKRSSTKRSIERIAGRVTGGDFDIWDVIQVETELNLLTAFWTQYLDTHEKLVSASADEVEVNVHQDAMTAVLDTYSDAVNVMARKLRDLRLQDERQRNTVRESVNVDRPSVVHNADEINRFLEKIKVPKFTGEQHRWLAFYKSFKSMVHDKGYAPVEKFHYLYNSLTEKTRKVIGGLDTAESYEEAWDTLIRRYDNKRVIVNAHLQHFTGFQLPAKPLSDDLLSLVDVTNLTTRSLRTMQIPTEHWDAILVFLISRKLDDKTREFWETEQKTTEIPKLDEMLACIESRARSLQLAEEARGQTRSTNVRNTHHRQPVTVHAAATADSGTSSASRPYCLLCKQEHWLHACPRLDDTPVNDRFALIRGIPNLCYNCLRTGHVKKECRSSSCKHCPNNQRHNSILCRRGPGPTMSHGAEFRARDDLSIASTSHSA